MSGFVAAVNLDGAPVDRGLLKRMAAWLAFRGPDAQRVHVAANAGLAHTLRKISDESEREQLFDRNSCLVEIVLRVPARRFR